MKYRQLTDYFWQNAIDIVAAFIIALVGWLLASWVRRKLISILKKQRSDPTYQLFIANALYAVALTMIAIIVLSKLGVPTASLLTILGASSLAIALALKDSLANIAAGLMIVFLKPFKLGDVVMIAQASGTIDSINLFTTSIRTPNNEVIHIPNAKLSNETITNKSARPTRRIELKVGISYNTDIQQARRMIKQLIANEERILKSPNPLIALKELADSAMILIIRVWVKNADYAAVQFDLLEQIKLGLDQHDIDIPYPQLEVKLKQSSPR